MRQLALAAALAAATALPVAAEEIPGSNFKSGFWEGAAYTDDLNTVPVSADGQRGRIAAYTIANLTVAQRLGDSLTIHGGIKNLADRRYLCGDEYNIADIATYPWYGNVVLNNQYEAAEFLDVGAYRNVLRWAEEIEARPAVKRGRRVNRIAGPEELRLPERHDASDLD